MAYAFAGLLTERELTHRELAEEFARKVTRVGGCVPQAAIPMLERMFDDVACLDGVKKLIQERDDLREKLRISEENRKLLAVGAFVKAGEDNG
jgi:hypothetical protein